MRALPTYPRVGLVALVACAAGAGCAASSNSPAPSVADSNGRATTSAPPFCPSAAEVERHWERQGEELKPSPDCPDPDPIPDSDNPEPRPTGPATHDPTTVSAAQRLHDPDDDPLIFVEQQKDGTYTSVTISVLDEAYIPPASVRTAQEYEQWLAEQVKQN